jgi:hypothetical protein
MTQISISAPAAAALAVVAACPSLADSASGPSPFNANDPAASGYTLVFNGTFNGPKDIDWSNTCQPGYKWYFCQLDNTGSSLATRTDGSLSVDPATGILTITMQSPGETPNMTALYSAGGGTPFWKSTSPHYVGNAFGGGGVPGGPATGHGFYIEFSIAFDPSAAYTSLTTARNYGWPAVWGYSVQRQIDQERGACTDPPAGAHWPGQAISPCYEHFIEDDFYEYNLEATGTPGNYTNKYPDSWDATVIDWYGNNGSSEIMNGAHIVNFAGTSSHHLINLLPLTLTAGVFNTYGQLYIAGSAANGWHGSIRNYFNGHLMSEGVDWIDQATATPGDLANTSTSTFTWSRLDNDPQFISIDGFYGGSLQVPWVRVWQLAS